MQSVSLVVSVLIEMTLASTEINNWYESLKYQELDRNDKSTATWSKYKNDLEVTKSLLSSIPKKVTHDVMVPIGPKALMRGKIVHTNEFLVNLGETWFVKRSAYQTTEICDRRIKSCDEMLEKLAKERELIINKSTLPAEQEAFGNEERPEIIEYVTEEENEEWKKQHRIKEQKYRQQLAEMRNKEKRPIETEEDLWNRLEELELQEELEDELNRLNAESSSEEDNSTENLESDNVSEQETASLKDIRDENAENKNRTANSGKVKRKVSFACDLDSSDDEPLRLEIKHSDCQPVPSSENSNSINSPVDIYNNYLKLLNKTPFSVLKHNDNFSIQNNLTLNLNDEIKDDDDDDNKEEENDLKVNAPLSSGVLLNDICERTHPNMLPVHSNTDYKIKKISKFKTTRKKGAL